MWRLTSLHYANAYQPCAYQQGAVVAMEEDEDDDDDADLVSEHDSEPASEDEQEDEAPAKGRKRTATHTPAPQKKPKVAGGSSARPPRPASTGPRDPVTPTPWTLATPIMARSTTTPGSAPGSAPPSTASKAGCSFFIPSVSTVCVDPLCRPSV